MTNIYTIVLAFCIISLSGCAAISAKPDDVIDTEALYKTQATEQQRLELIGRWYRKQLTKDGGVSEELTQMNADGSYLFQFKFSHEGVVTNTYVESGLWGISGGYHFTFALAEGHSNEEMWPVDPEDHKNYWVYKVLELSQSNFRYQTVATGDIFELRRVADDFRLQ